MNALLTIALLVIIQVAAIYSLPFLNFGGFSWAENLAFDGRGNLFVSEAIRGELWRISLCSNGTEYCGEVHVDKGISQFGGLAVTRDGLSIYAGVTFHDKSKGVVKASTAVGGVYSTIGKTVHQPNGMAADWKRNTLYYTDEGTKSDVGGTLTAMDITTGVEKVVALVPWADGCFFDEKTQKLYVGELVSKKIHVFSVSDNGITLDAIYPGLSNALNLFHIIDDITLDTTGTNSADMNSTVLFAADWTGRTIQRFNLNGDKVSEISAPEGLSYYEPTSVRWGKGPGFDSNSLYITEGGGATQHQTKRRVLQIPMN